MATQTELIRGKVAKILNSRELALNIGKQQGVESGMLFDILSDAGLDIKDPDTDEELGSVDLPKTRVKITRVYDTLSVASTYRTKRVRVGGGVGPVGIGSLFEPPVWETHHETLKASGSFERSGEDLGESQSYVSRGDRVVQVVDDEQT